MRRQNWREQNEVTKIHEDSRSESVLMNRYASSTCNTSSYELLPDSSTSWTTTRMLKTDRAARRSISLGPAVETSRTSELHWLQVRNEKIFHSSTNEGICRANSRKTQLGTTQVFVLKSPTGLAANCMRVPPTFHENSNTSGSSIRGGYDLSKHTCYMPKKNMFDKDSLLANLLVTQLWSLSAENAHVTWLVYSARNLTAKLQWSPNNPRVVPWTSYRRLKRLRWNRMKSNTCVPCLRFAKRKIASCGLL